MRPGDLIFIRGASPIDHIVERISHSTYSHVAGVIRPNELIESQSFRRTGYAALDTYKGVSDVYTCPTLTDDQRNAIVQFVLKRIGTRYNYALIGWEYVHFALHFDLPYHESTCYDCSELWSAAYKSVGVNLRPDLEHVAPGDLAASPLLTRLEDVHGR